MKPARSNAGANLTERIVASIRELHRELGREAETPIEPSSAFADLLDSMEHVEFLLRLARELHTTPEQIEMRVAHRFGTVVELADALQKAETTQPDPQEIAAVSDHGESALSKCWLGPCVAELPRQLQSAEELSRRLRRPANWLEKRAGIVQRHCWDKQDPLRVAADAGRRCLQEAGLAAGDVGALLVTSEAPPLVVGLAAALHSRLGLPVAAPAFEIGGACTGFLAGLFMGRALLARAHVVLLLALEAPTLCLDIRPGKAGEAAALFGDAAACCMLSDRPASQFAPSLVDLFLETDGSRASLLQVKWNGKTTPQLSG